MSELFEVTNMKILVISGFLGAGKTTFIKKMVEMTSHNYVILENEYGELGLDGKFLKDGQGESEAQIDIWELTEGCICCSVKADFATSILTIANTLDPEYLIVEPTGVGMLSNVIANIKKIEYERIQLLKPVTIIDANCFYRDLREYGDIYADQIRSTGTALFSKTEHISGEELQQMCKTIGEMGDQAVVEAEHYSKKTAEWWEDLLQSYHDPAMQPAASPVKTPDLESVALPRMSLPSFGAFLQLLEMTVRGHFGDVRRAKGSVKIDGYPFRFDVVDLLYTISGGMEADDEEGVFIGRNLQRELLAGYSKETALDFLGGRLKRSAPLRLKKTTRRNGLRTVQSRRGRN